MPTRTQTLIRREKMETPFATLIDLFLATKKTEGKSPKTITWYGEFLRKFLEYLGTEAKIGDFTLDSARSFVAHLQSRTCRFENHPLSPRQEGGLSPFTIHGYVRTLKAFSSWLAEEGFTTGNVLARLKAPKLPTPVIEILSQEEIEAILGKINPNCFLGARLYAALLLLLDTGIRAQELCTLTVDSVFLNEDYIKVRGKGNKERLAPFCAATKKALLRYLTTFRPEPAADIKNVFLTLEGLPWGYNGLLQAIKRVGRAAGVPRLHPHLLRHTFAVNYLINGGDVMTLKMILGHTSLEVTQVYMHLAEAHVQLQHNKFSPVARLVLNSRKKGRR